MSPKLVIDVFLVAMVAHTHNQIFKHYNRGLSVYLGLDMLVVSQR